MAKWSSGKKKLNIDGYGEISYKFLITSYILLRICLGDYDMHSQPSAFQVRTFNSQEDVKKVKTYFATYSHLGVPNTCVKIKCR